MVKKILASIALMLCLATVLPIGAEVYVYDMPQVCLTSYASSETGQTTSYERLPEYVSETGKALSTASEYYYSDIDSFADAVRVRLIARDPSATMYYKTPVRIDDVFFDDLYDALFRKCDDPRGGDYLRFTMEYYKIYTQFVKNNDYYYYTLYFEMEYYTTAEQEKEVDSAIADLADSVNSYYTNDYDKVLSIYNYICRTVSYDYKNLEDDEYVLKYTAYAALINKTAVCQGYANLFYRLARECGIDARIISGVSNGGSHAWNIVKLNGYYYNLDSTWDASDNGFNRKYDYFLRCDANFPDHTPNEGYLTEEFLNEYPKWHMDYDPKNPAHRHEFISDIIIESYATAYGDGVKYRLCNCGEQGDITVTPFSDSSLIYPDLTVNAWSKNYIDFVSSNGFMGDVGNGNFAQGALMTRAMFVTILWRLDGSAQSDAQIPFIDLDDEQKWYHEAVAWAYDNNIIKGTGEFSFSPELNITREQIVVILQRYVSYLNYDTEYTTQNGFERDFSDSDTVSSFATDAVKWAFNCSIINGQSLSDGSVLISPLKNATREETAVIIGRLFDNILLASAEPEHA